MNTKPKLNFKKTPQKQRSVKPIWQQVKQREETNYKMDSYLVELFGHLADDLCILHVPEHLDPHGAWLQKVRDRS